MYRLTRLLCLSALLSSGLPSFAADSVAVYAGTEKITSTGGGNSNSSDGSSTGVRRQPVFIAIDTATGTVQRVTLQPAKRKFTVEAAVDFDQTFNSTGTRRPKQFTRLMLVNHTDKQPGEFTNTASQYDGRSIDTVIASAGLAMAYPRVLKWSFDFQYSGFVVAPPDVTTFPQIDSGTALLSLNRNITKASVGKNLDMTMDVIRGVLTGRHYTEQ